MLRAAESFLESKFNQVGVCLGKGLKFNYSFEQHIAKRVFTIVVAHMALNRIDVLLCVSVEALLDPINRL